jgi:hypothetical protein
VIPGKRFIFFALLYVGLFGSLVWSHETAHAAIYSEYGCTSEYGFSSLAALTIGHCPPMSESRQNSLDESQALVEAIGYPFLCFILLYVFFNGVRFLDG